jgi:two-component system, sensor histidine kinase
VLADEKRLRQVLLNLLSNAVKFTDQGEVVLSVRRVGEEIRDHATLRFEVHDTGVGMPQDQLEKIFQPFEQTGDARRRTVGTGLGLAISRQLVQLMGGDIHVASELGLGTVFSFELEFRLVPAAQASTTAEAEIVGYDGPRKRVLVVDDMAANRLVMRDLLQPLGFEIDEAGDGRRAVERALANSPDLIVMDIAMPVMDGRQAMALIHRIDALRHVPIIAVSASVEIGEVLFGPGRDAVAFLPKPVDREQLLREIARQLGLTWRWKATPTEHWAER